MEIKTTFNNGKGVLVRQVMVDYASTYKIYLCHNPQLYFHFNAIIGRGAILIQRQRYFRSWPEVRN